MNGGLRNTPANSIHGPPQRAEGFFVNAKLETGCGIRRCCAVGRRAMIFWGGRRNQLAVLRIMLNRRRVSPSESALLSFLISNKK